jgi:selenocysteine lyase/cysteine desulfurase
MENLRSNWRIEVPVFAWPDAARRLIRVSAQQYNKVADYEQLAEALVAELAL